MILKKKKILVLCIAIVVIIVLLCFYCGRVSGDQVLDYIPMEDVTEIVVRKTIDDGKTIKDCGTFQLNQAEAEQFCHVFSEAKLKDIGKQSFPIRTTVRYYVYFNVSNSRINGTMEFYEGTMEFYGDDVLIFDYVYGDRPAVHERYSIRLSSLEDFFESIFD